MFLKLFQRVRHIQADNVFLKRIHTQICLSSLFDQRRNVENEWKKVQNEWKNVQNEWNDDEDEQRRAFREEEKKIVENNNQQIIREITEKKKYQSHYEYKGACCTKQLKQLETYLIHYEGGVGTIPKNKN